LDVRAHRNIVYCAMGCSYVGTTNHKITEVLHGSKVITCLSLYLILPLIVIIHADLLKVCDSQHSTEWSNKK